MKRYEITRWTTTRKNTNVKEGVVVAKVECTEVDMVRLINDYHMSNPVYLYESKRM